MVGTHITSSSSKKSIIGVKPRKKGRVFFHSVEATSTVHTWVQGRDRSFRRCKFCQRAACLTLRRCRWQWSEGTLGFPKHPVWRWWCSVKLSWWSKTEQVLALASEQGTKCYISSHSIHMWQLWQFSRKSKYKCFACSHWWANGSCIHSASSLHA